MATPGEANAAALKEQQDKLKNMGGAGLGAGLKVVNLSGGIVDKGATTMQYTVDGLLKVCSPEVLANNTGMVAPAQIITRLRVACCCERSKKCLLLGSPPL